MDPWSTVDDLTQGNAGLRQQIALRYLIDGVQISPDDIVINNGAIVALNVCLATVCSPGDAVVVECPCFYMCLQVLERLGLHAIEVATDPREGIDLVALEVAIIRHRPKACWVMTNFQNPLGSVMSDEKKRALVELITRHQVPLIEVRRRLRFQGLDGALELAVTRGLMSACCVTGATACHPWPTPR